MWIRVLQNFDWKPKPQVTLAFLRGQERNVPRACADQAVAAGKAVRMKKATKTDGQVTDSRQPS